MINTTDPTTATNSGSNDDDTLEFVSLSKNFLRLFGLFFFGYLVGYFGLSLWWISIVALVTVIRSKRHAAQQRRVEFHRAINFDEKGIIKSVVKDLPCWVYFPDTERAEWINKILKQMWPFISEYLTNVLKTQIEQNIDDIMPDYFKGFRFEKIDFGSIAPRLASVKCYDELTDRDEIILDLELIYAGNSDFQVKIKGLSAGIKDFQLYGILRVELKPLINQMPIVGCISFYFLKTPVIEYNFTNLGNVLDVPLLSEFLKKGMDDLLNKQIVLPNKYVFPLVADLQVGIKCIQPIGLVRLEVIEARCLKKSDVGMLGLGKSDPYVNIIIGNQEFRSITIYNTVNPKWNFICETPIFLTTQSIDLEVMDEDQGSKDDFLGRASLSLETIFTEGIIDAWINLKETKTGKIHLKVTWLTLEHSTQNLVAQMKEKEILRAKYGEEGRETLSYGSVACLLVYLDCAKNLPIPAKSIGEPSPQVIFNLRRQVQKSVVKNFTSNPIWQESFHYLLDEFNAIEELSIEVIDNKSNKQLGQVGLRLASLTEAKDMTLSDPLVVRQFGHNFDLHATISLHFIKSPKTEHVKIVRDDTVESNDSDNIPTMEDLIKGTIEPFAMFSGIQGDIIGRSQHKRQPMQNGKELDNIQSHQEGSNPSSSLKSDTAYPMLEVSIHKIFDENKLEVLVHKASNLRKVNNRLPDPFVKLYMLPEKGKANKKNRSVTVKSSCNPVFEESFIIDLNDNIDSLKFVVYTATGAMFKRNKIILGFVEIFFNNNFLEKNVSFTKWYELEQQDD